MGGTSKKWDEGGISKGKEDKSKNNIPQGTSVTQARFQKEVKGNPPEKGRGGRIQGESGCLSAWDTLTGTKRTEGLPGGDEKAGVKEDGKLGIPQTR